MKFQLTDEQLLLQETLRAFLSNECATPRLRDLFDQGQGNDPGHWKSLCEMGLVGALVSEERGGSGMGIFDLALVAELLGEYALPSPLLHHALACVAIERGGSEALRRSLVPGLVAGERIATLAVQEGDAVWAPGEWTTRLDGTRLTGAKTLVPHANVADLLVVGLSGGAWAVVDAKGPGVSVADLEGLDRTRPVSTVSFDDAEAERLAPGPEGAPDVADAAVVAVAADALGAATKLLELDVAYALERKQFGQPIASFQAVKHAIARIATDLEPARSLLWRAAHAQEHEPEGAARWASLVKAHLSDRAMETARASVELHGGYGYTWECEVQMWYKRIALDRCLFGLPAQHRDRCARLAGW